MKQLYTTQHQGVFHGFPLPMGWTIMVVILSMTACAILPRDEKPINSDPVPLTPAIWFSPSGMTASIAFQNACHETATIPVADLLSGSVPNKLTRVFTGVLTKSQSEDILGVDGVIEVGLGVRRLDVAVPHQRPGEYPASATVGLEMAFLARDGTMLFSKKFEGTARGSVVVPEQSCEIKGLEAIVDEAIGSAADGLAQQMAQSVQLRDYANQRDRWAPLSSHPVPLPREVAEAGPSITQESRDESSATTSTAVEPAHLSFRAIMRDESRNQVLEPDESLTLHLEVKNEGTVHASDVVVLVNGNAGLEQVFPPEVTVGSLQPGEIKHISVTKRVATSNAALPGELTLNLRAASPMAIMPAPKVFHLGVASTRGDVMSLPDVDQMPMSMRVTRQPKAVIIAIGVGTFGDEQMPVIKYASHDAAVMAEYLHAINGVSRERMRIVLDRQGVQQELEETFERWLRTQAEADTVLYVFFSGRVVVDSRNGELLLVPYDGTLSDPGHLYPLKRLKEAVAKLPVRRAIFMFDTSLDPSPGADLTTMPLPDWTSGVDEQRKDMEMWMVGNRHLQEAQVSEPGKHGLFTYHLLRGLQGAADLDRDGTVMAGELCLYARGEVARVTREPFGNKQDPLCLPPVGRGGMVRIHPIAKGNNPKPLPTGPPSEKPVVDSTGPAPSPMLVGP